jgi:hypothetical protein
MTAPSKQFLTDFEPYGPLLHNAAQSVFQRLDARAEALHGLIQNLPEIRPSNIVLDRDRITIGCPSDLSVDQQNRLKETLLVLKPGNADLIRCQIHRLTLNIGAINK